MVLISIELRHDFRNFHDIFLKATTINRLDLKLLTQKKFAMLPIGAFPLMIRKIKLCMFQQYYFILFLKFQQLQESKK